MVRYSRVYADRLAAARARAEEKRARREDNYVEERRRERTRQATHAAIERGELVRPEVCGSCGGGGVIEAHHVDYDDPLQRALALQRMPPRGARRHLATRRRMTSHVEHHRRNRRRRRGTCGGGRDTRVRSTEVRGDEVGRA